jgi:hypothetical protein
MTDQPLLPPPTPDVGLAEDILAEWTARPGLIAAFLGGSVAKGTARPGSDIDAVLIFSALPQAVRETHARQGVTVELICHDTDTLGFAWQADRRAGRARLARMIAGGLPIDGDPAMIEALKGQAAALLEAGPEPLTPEQLVQCRYRISDMAGDLHPDCDWPVRLAVGCRLYAELADFTLRVAGQWSASGKGLARALNRHDPALATWFELAFRQLFAEMDSGPLQDLVDHCLAPCGGRLLVGMRQVWPPDWRIGDD